MCLIQEHKSHDAVSIELCTVVVRCVPGYKHINMIWTGPGIHPRKEGRKVGSFCLYAHMLIDRSSQGPYALLSYLQEVHIHMYSVFEVPIRSSRRTIRCFLPIIQDTPLLMILSGLCLACPLRAADGRRHDTIL